MTIDSGTPAATFNASWSYELPFGKGQPFLKNAAGFTDSILGGWRLSGSLIGGPSGRAGVRQNRAPSPIGNTPETFKAQTVRMIVRASSGG